KEKTVDSIHKMDFVYSLTRGRFLWHRMYSFGISLAAVTNQQDRSLHFGTSVIVPQSNSVRVLTIDLFSL
ncbi:hypothetical protein, partial [Enterococcus florum]|uniref:hypothetical protein n=1 Tax=Enterococcus florum TaxID=2480627 RepID=UPI001D1309E6